jgi:peptidyl-prolyl isomerase D
VRAIENNPTASGDVPLEPVEITDCGTLPADDPSLSESAVQEAEDGDPYEDYPEDEDRNISEALICLEIAKAVREVGNRLFKEGKIDAAYQKYLSTSNIYLSPYQRFAEPAALQNPFDTSTTTGPLPKMPSKPSDWAMKSSSSLCCSTLLWLPFV